MTRFEIQGTTLKLKERARIDDVMRKNEYTTLGTISKDKIKKVFENPITAIAYEFNDFTEIPFVEFDKKDIIRALDFWIANRIQLNERRLFLKGSLRDVDEEELRKLIMTRKYVEGEPNNAKFARVDKKVYHTSVFETWTVTFFELLTKRTVKKPIQANPNSITYNFNDNWRQDGARFDFTSLGTTTTASDEVVIRMSGGRHDETDEQMATRLYNDGIHLGGLITREELRDAFRVPMPTTNNNDFNYDHPPTGRYYRLNNGNVQTNLTAQQIMQLSLQIRRQLPIPEISNDPTAPNYDPNVPITNNFANMSIHELYNTVFEDMICSETSQTGMAAGTAGHITARLILFNGPVEIDVEILTTGTGLDSILGFGRSFRVSLLSNNYIQIDGRTYDMVNYTVRETINFNNIPEGIPRRFNNFRITGVQRFQERYMIELESTDHRVIIENICLRRTTTTNLLMDRIGIGMSISIYFTNEYMVGIGGLDFQHQLGERPVVTQHQLGERPVVTYRSSHAM